METSTKISSRRPRMPRKIGRPPSPKLAGSPSASASLWRSPFSTRPAGTKKIAPEFLFGLTSVATHRRQSPYDSRRYEHVAEIRREVPNCGYVCALRTGKRGGANAQPVRFPHQPGECQESGRACAGGSGEEQLERRRSDRGPCREPHLLRENGQHATGQRERGDIQGVVPVEGGIPLVADGKIVGAIGVSGVTSTQDNQCAKAGADTVK